MPPDRFPSRPADRLPVISSQQSLAGTREGQLLRGTAAVAVQRRDGGLDSAIAFVLFCLGLGYLYLFHQLGWFLQDDGVLYYHFLRTHRGQLPYRDFFTGYGPVTLYLHSSLFSLFGESIDATRVFMAVVNAFSAAGLYLVARRLVSRLFAVIPPLLFLSMQPGDIAAMAFHNIPYPIWYGMLFGVWGIWTMLRAMETRSRTRRAAWIVATGVIGGLALFSKQNAGVFFLWGVTGFLASYPRSPAESVAPGPRLMTAVRIGYLVLIPLAVLVVIKNFLSFSTVLLFFLPTASLAAVGARRRFDRVAFRGAVVDFLLLGLGVALAVGPWLAYFSTNIGVGGFLDAIFFFAVDVDRNLFLAHPLPGVLTWFVLGCALAVILLYLMTGRREDGLRALPQAPRWRRVTVYTLIAMPVLAVLGFGVFYAKSIWRFFRFEYNLWLFYESFSTGMDNAASYLSFVVLALAIGLTWRQAGGTVRERDPAPAPFLCVLWVSACLLVLYYPRMDAAHLVGAAAPLYVVAVAVLQNGMERWSKAFHAAGRPSIPRVAKIVCILLAAFVIGWKLAPKFYSRTMLARHHGTVSLVSTPSEFFHYPGFNAYFPIYREAQRLQFEAFRDVISYVQSETDQDEPIFTFPALPMVYFVADRPNATRHDYFLGNNVSFTEQLGVVRTLERLGVELIILPSDKNDYFLKKSKDFTRLIHGYLRQGYYLDHRVGPYDVLRRYGS